MEILADKSIKVISVNDSIEIKASQKIVLQAGQSSITLEGGDITFACPGNFTVKGGQHLFEGGASAAAQMVQLPEGALPPDIGPAPRTAREWREYAAVLDSFNGDGFFVTAKVIGNKGPKAAVGTVSEQFGKQIPGQHLPGGATQAFFYLDRAFWAALSKAGQDFAKGERVSKVVDTATGLEFTFHRTGWTDANGIYIQQRHLAANRCRATADFLFSSKTQLGHGMAPHFRVLQGVGRLY
nr:DUF2345 domain-containing protein [Duganella aceris]